jgi:hypothetical protein
VGMCSRRGKNGDGWESIRANEQTINLGCESRNETVAQSKVSVAAIQKERSQVGEGRG